MSSPVVGSSRNRISGLPQMASANCALAVTALQQIRDTGQGDGIGNAARPRVVAAEQADQLADIERVRHACGLQHRADAPARGQRMRRLSEYLRAAGVRTQQPEQQRDRRRLASAVGSEHGEHFAAPNIERHLIERQNRSIALAGAVQLRDRCLIRSIHWLLPLALEQRYASAQPVLSRVHHDLRMTNVSREFVSKWPH